MKKINNKLDSALWFSCLLHMLSLKDIFESDSLEHHQMKMNLKEKKMTDSKIVPNTSCQFIFWRLPKVNRKGPAESFIKQTFWMKTKWSLMSNAIVVAVWTFFSKNPSFWLEMLFSDADLAASEDLWRFCPCLEAFFTLGGRFAAVSHEIDHKAAKTYFE